MKNIMILEDDLDIREVMGIILSDHYQVEMVKDLENWKDYLQGDLPDLILLDIKLGVANGVDIAKWIKNNPRTAQIKIILTTASMRVNDIENWSDAFLEKPFEIETLIATVQQVFNQNHLYSSTPRNV